MRKSVHPPPLTEKAHKNREKRGTKKVKWGIKGKGYPVAMVTLSSSLAQMGRAGNAWGGGGVALLPPMGSDHRSARMLMAAPV